MPQKVFEDGLQMAKLTSIVWKLDIQLQQVQNDFPLAQKSQKSKNKKWGRLDEFWARFNSLSKNENLPFR